nr:uncharacterized protein LOC129445797 [Misgurnus anguillicaudatus]
MSLHSRPAPVQLLCVDNQTNRRAASYEVTGNKIEVASYKTTTSSVLTNGHVTFTVHKNDNVPAFQEGLTYIVKNYGTYTRFGLECMSIEPTTKIFRSAPLEVSEEIQRRAKHILNPPSPEMTGDEADLFTGSPYVSLRGHIENMFSYRMIHRNDGDVPIRDLILRCGESFIEVSLWQDEALAELHMGAEIVVTHLRATIKLNGKAKFNSSRFSSVEVPDHPRTREWFTIIGFLENEDDLVLLVENYDVYSMSADLFPGTSSDFLEKLPLNVEVEQANYRVYSIQYLDIVAE